MAASVDALAAKVEAGERLSDVDLDALASSRDIIALGMLASAVRRRLHGAEVTYLRVADRQPDAVAGEFRILETPPTLDAAVEVVTNARDVAGTTPLSAFCLFELGKLPEGLPVVLAALKRAGLEMIAQAPVDRLTSPEEALEALTDAGLQLARLTVAGIPDRPWVSVCCDVAALETRLRSIRVFAPLPRMIDAAHPTTGYEDVRRVAISRIVADNVPTIQVDWALYGPKLAQVALAFGADDIDSVSAANDDSKGRRRSPVEEIQGSIRAAGFEPVERDGRFERRR